MAQIVLVAGMGKISRGDPVMKRTKDFSHCPRGRNVEDFRGKPVTRKMKGFLDGPRGSGRRKGEEWKKEKGRDGMDSEKYTQKYLEEYPMKYPATKTSIEA